MKQFFTLLITLLSFQFAFTQITISESEIYVPGNTFHLANDTLPDASIQPGAAGNIDWDFSALQSHDTSIFEIIDAAGTPFAANYPNANVAILSDSVYIYLEKSTAKLEVVGSAFREDLDSAILEVIFNYTNPESVVELPANVGDTYSDDAHFYFTTSGDFFGVDSIRFKTGNTSETAIDGFGNITTPAGTFEALRMTRQNISFDTIELQTFGFWVPFDEAAVGDTSLAYSWMTNQTGFEYPLVSVEMALDSTTGAEIVGTASWVTGSLVPTSKINVISNAEVFPIPATDILNFQLTKPFEGQVDIIDFNGKKLASQTVNADFIKIDLANFLSGNYVAVFSKNDGKIAGFKKFNVVK